jgi:hypothetical protein
MIHTLTILLWFLSAGISAGQTLLCGDDPGVHFVSPYNTSYSDGYPYWSGPTNFSIGPLRVMRVPATDVSKACKIDDLNALLNNANYDPNFSYALLLEGMIDSCYPETTAKVAAQTNFDIQAVLTVNANKLLGTKPILLWATNSAPIPVIEVGALAQLHDASVNWQEAELCLYPSDNPYDDWIVRGFLIVLGSLCMILATWKLVLCLTRINGKLPVSYTGEDCSLMNHASTLIIVFESVASVACISHQGVDPWGFLHFLDYPFVRVVSTITQIFPFFTFFIVACILQDAVVDVEQIGETKMKEGKRSWKNIVWIEFALGCILVLIITTVDMVNMVGDLLRIETVLSSSTFAVYFYLGYAALSGIYYFVMKSRIIRLFRRMPVHLINKNFAREVEDMSNCLFLSGYCIFGYVISMVCYLLLQKSKRFPFYAWSSAIACLNGAGILQVCAIQRVHSASKVTFKEGDPATIQTAPADEEKAEGTEKESLLKKSSPVKSFPPPAMKSPLSSSPEL